MEFKKVIDKFFNDYNSYQIKELTGGNINKTYSLSIDFGDISQKFVLQSLNKLAFKNQKAVMDNISVILDYLNDKSLYYLKTINGENCYIDEENNLWRVYNFVPNSISYSVTSDLSIIKEVGRAYGSFFAKLRNLSQDKLFVTIKDFHNTKKRFQKLKEVANFKNERFFESERYYNKLINLEEKALILQNYHENGELPLRIVHNDTKFNNILLDADTKKSIAVIDLDTVMPGLIAYDFGDGARSICSNKQEDDCDYENIVFDLDKFSAFSSGFLPSVKEFLSDLEKETIYMGILTITVELSVRFLTDYLQGDIYFKTSYQKQNLVRAINQYTLACDIIKKEDEIQEIVSQSLK